MGEITEQLKKWSGGDVGAAAATFAASYPELKRIAHARLYAANLRQGIDTESLLHESFLKLVNQKTLPLEDRKQFFAYAAKTMRNIILDAVRESKAQRRGSGHAPVTLDTDMAAQIAAPTDDLENISEALDELEQTAPELAELVELKFFGGLTEPEIAKVKGVSERTVRRDWVKARAALLVLMES